jgi:hypothetical protein
LPRPRVFRTSIWFCSGGRSAACLPKVLPLADLADIDAATCRRLADAGIKTSEDLYEAYLSGDLGDLPPGQADALFAQCDLVRIKRHRAHRGQDIHRGAAMARAGRLADANASAMLERLLAANAAGAFYAGSLGSARTCSSASTAPGCWWPTRASGGGEGRPSPRIVVAGQSRGLSASGGYGRE